MNRNTEFYFVFFIIVVVVVADSVVLAMWDNIFAFSVKNRK